MPKRKKPVRFTKTGEVIYDKMELWKTRIRVAKKIREIELKDYDKLKGFYEGKQWWDEDVPLLEDRTTVNMIFATIKKELAYLYFQNPSPIVNAKRMQYELSAYASQELLKYYTKYNLGEELKKQIRLAILDAKFAFGCIKAIYTPLFEENPDVGQPILLGYNDFGEPIFLTDEEGNLIGQRDNILVSELYYAERISPKEILIDPECRNFPERSKWVAHELIKPLNYMKKNKLYKNTQKLQSNVTFDELYKSGIPIKEETRELLEQHVKFYEIFDKENKELLVIADGYDNFLREDSMLIDPFTFLKFNERPDEFYPLPDVRIEKPLQEEINIGRSQMITHARRAARKYGYEKGTIAELELNKLKDPEDMTLFEITDISKMPVPLGLAVQDPSIFQNLMQSRIDYNEVAASTEAERGVVERRKTFGEAKFIESHAAARRADKQSLVADFIKEIYSKLLKLMQNTLTLAQAVKIIGPAGQFWVNISREDIIGEFFVDIEVAELKPQIPEVEKQEVAEFMFALANLLNAIVQNPLMFQILNLQGLISEMAKFYPTVKVEKILNMAVTPEQIIEQAQTMQTGQGGPRPT